MTIFTTTKIVTTVLLYRSERRTITKRQHIKGEAQFF